MAKVEKTDIKWEPKPQVFDAPSIVSLRGYVDQNERVRQAVNAGIMLEEWRKGVYDYDEETDERDMNTILPALRQKGYNLADTTETLKRGRSTSDRLFKKAIEEAHRAKAEIDTVVSTGDSHTNGSSPPAAKKPSPQE